MPVSVIKAAARSIRNGRAGNYPRWAPRLITAVFTGAAAQFGLSLPASAACTTSTGNADLGSVSSQTAANTSQGVSASSGFSCSSSGILAVNTTNTISAKINSSTNISGAQFRLHDASTNDYINYTLCRDSNCTQTYTINDTITWSSTTLLGILNLFTGPNGTLPLYVKTITGSHVAAGTYTGSITFNWTWSVCAVGATVPLTGLTICAVTDTGSQSAAVTIKMVVTKDCAITAPAINFGDAALVSSFDTVTNTIIIRCTKGATYKVGINNGANPDGTVRRMAHGANYIRYDVFYPANSTTRWGGTDPHRRTNADATTNATSLTGTTDQTFVYSAKVDAQQPTPVGGSYKDTLTLNIEF